MTQAIDYSVVMKAVQRHIVKTIYTTKPSKVDKSWPSWKKFGGEQIDIAAKDVRVFDVVSSDEGPTLQFQHNNGEDLNVPVVIEIAYSDDPHINHVAHSDYRKIKWALENSDKGELYDLGFDFFIFDELEPSLDPVEEELEYRFLRIVIGCRIRITAGDLFDTVNNTTDSDNVWINTVWSEDVIRNTF